MMDNKGVILEVNGAPVGYFVDYTIDKKNKTVLLGKRYDYSLKYFFSENDLSDFGRKLLQINH